MKTFVFKYLAPVILISAQHGLAVAQAPSKDGRSMADIASYAGPDRMAKLVEGAKKEGELSVYYAHPIVKNMMDAFGEKYGIKVKAWRGGSEAMQQRIMTEARAGRHDVDIFLTPSMDVEAAHREKLLQEVRSPVHQELVPTSVPAHRQWAAWNIEVWTLGYNTNLVKKDELPKSWDDLADPKWKGRLGIEANNHVWFGTLIGQMGEERGRKLFENVVATNGISVRKGHSLLAGLVASGEVPLALTLYNWNTTTLKAKGAPVEQHLLPPLLGMQSGIAVMNKAPNPNAAILFYDFVLNEGQKISSDAGFISTRKTIPSPLGNLPIKPIDAVQALDLNERWFKIFSETVTSKAK